MDLRRLKTIFIFVLIAINVIFFALIYNVRSYEKNENRLMTENMKTLLSKSMIYLPDTVQLPQTPEISGYYLEKMYGSNEELLLKFLGADYVIQSDGTYKSDEGVLVLDGDEFKFFYAKPIPASTDFSEDELESVSRDEMKKQGIFEKLYVFSGLNFVDDGMRTIFTVQHDEDVFFDAYVSFDINETGIVAVSGKNLVSDMVARRSNSRYLSIISILPDIVDNPELEKDVSHSIVSITHGYYIGETLERYRNILAIPVWQIATDTGHMLYYDARNGQSIEK